MSEIDMGVTAIGFTVLGKAEPQGSTKAFMVKGRPRITSANPKMKPYRQEVGQTALFARAALGIHGVWAGRHVPVSVRYDFYFAKPKSVPKGRISPAVKPDIDKLVRSTTDALTGILYADDGQIIKVTALKHYGLPERTEIKVWRED
jgi:crossover junction endodeoxyribonuclease RusA